MTACFIAGTDTGSADLRHLRPPPAARAQGAWPSA